MRILLLEDDAALGGAVREHLVQAGHAVDLVRGVEDARCALAGVDYALLLLDLGLPDGSGLDLLRELRARDDWRPVLLLTARDRLGDRIAGLQAGADDYLVKPFDLEELSARLQAVARRAGLRPGPAFRAGEVELDLAGRRARLAGEEVTLTGREWAILERLLRRPGTVVSREQIEEALYGFGAEAESNTVEVRVSRIRKKLGARLIETMRGVGYRVRV